MEKQQFKRVHLIVLDSVGIGESPDAHLFGDEGADTLGTYRRSNGRITYAEYGQTGLSNISEIQGVPVANRTTWRFMEKCRKHLLGKIR